MREDNQALTCAFEALDLPPLLKQGIKEAGFSHCTPIQAKTLPLALAGKDVAGQAQTGTGKTAAFLIAVMNRLMGVSAKPQPARQPRALILAPTRELAIQIHKDAEVLGRYSGLKFTVVFGGAGYETQRAEVKAGVDVLIGTPGRLIDYYKQHAFDLNSIEAVVIDEADRMFDLGFIKDIRFLLRRLPKPDHRLSMLFSATLSWRVTELAYEHMNNPQIVKIESEKMTAEKVHEAAYYPSNAEKIPLLVGLLNKLQPVRSMVFVNTKRVGDEVLAVLQANGINADLLSGDVPQKKRMRLLERFQSGELHVLVATDVAARGLHIPDVTHVFNFDLPQDSEDYVHRVGRTARAGASGYAISFVCETYAFSLPEIENYVGHKIPAESVTPDLLAEVVAAVHKGGRHHAHRQGGRHQRPGAHDRSANSSSTGKRRRRRSGRSSHPHNASSAS